MTTTLDDLKAPIIVIFKQIVANQIKAGNKGRCLFLYKNAEMTGSYQLDTYKSAVITLEDEALDRYVKQLFAGGCKVVHVLQYPTDVAGVKTVIDGIKADFDWLMSVDSSAQSAIDSYADENEKFAMVYNIQADSINVCSIANPSAELIVGDETEEITGLELIPIIGGVACGCPYDKSISYKVFTELKSVAQPSTYNQGQLTLYAEEEGIRLANACNTLQTLGTTYSEDMKALAIVEGMRRIKTDIIKAFRQGYKGRYKNSYDNQCLFYSAVNYGYLRELENLGVLDPDYDNRIYTDVEAQRNAWLARGKQEAVDWTDEYVRKMTVSNMIYATLDCKLLDAIEGMQLTVEMV